MSIIKVIVFTLLAFSQTWEFSAGNESPPSFDSYIKVMNSTELQAGNELRCMTIQSRNESQPINVFTTSSLIGSRQYTYINVPKQNCFNIYVKAKYNAHIALAKINNKISTPMVELHLRPFMSNQAKLDYKSKQIESKYMKDLLYNEEYRGYWFQLNPITQQLSIGKIGEDPFIVKNIQYFTIDSIGLSTSVGNIGDFLIKKHASCPGNKNDNLYDHMFGSDFKTKCYIINTN